MKEIKPGDCVKDLNGTEWWVWEIKLFDNNEGPQALVYRTFRSVTKEGVYVFPVSQLTKVEDVVTITEKSVIFS